jgi:phosphatidylethanolamine-binding protein (PEBP) family uncharacterized protein
VAHARHQAYIATSSSYTRSITTLALSPTSKRKVVDAAIKGHIIAGAALMGMYARKGGKR